MTHRLARTAFIALFCVVSQVAHGAAGDVGTDAESQRVLAVDDAWSAAEVKNDVATLGRIIDDAFVFNNSDGKTTGKAQLLEKVAKWRMTGQTISERSVVVVGETAVVLGTTELRFAASPQERKFTLRYTATYVRRAGEWRALAIQMDHRDGT